MWCALAMDWRSAQAAVVLVSKIGTWMVFSSGADAHKREGTLYLEISRSAQLNTLQSECI